MHANGTSPKRLVGPMMEKLKEHTTSEDGDVGPDGMNLPKYWMEQEDRAMLVAVESVVTKNDTTTFCADTTMDATASDIDTNDATTKGKSKWAPRKHNPDQKPTWDPSMARLSVDASARHSGVGRALMEEAERWIVMTEGKKMNGSSNSDNNKIMKMQLVTGNGIAADFYKAIGYRKRYWVLDYFGLPGWFEKEL
ncbi:hypothetical protein FRACYDRAFT_246409 [Fragilariopsis cylindrus CCMP1102]|uniref:N-acetyltransferase domain-containing protein n=1 Tax=Fragilariopsis cylindrus CCMP1102 TaxID=635003 RepID=A0A1E7EZR7_9STRA|nr:hypothetical protein FRACYDRAFT_246409 [Fragilariopsis cylindrus CCMP1102]|eukprot:OEU11295.1 hypothetical protein FRACYDRAFT_246409 [Fragilariopsis cylindrus CCMP1102]